MSQLSEWSALFRDFVARFPWGYGIWNIYNELVEPASRKGSDLTVIMQHDLGSFFFIFLDRFDWSLHYIFNNEDIFWNIERSLYLLNQSEFLKKDNNLFRRPATSGLIMFCLSEGLWLAQSCHILLHTLAFHNFTRKSWEYDTFEHG